jgi:hypothetical protein
MRSSACAGSRSRSACSASSSALHSVNAGLGAAAGSGVVFNVRRLRAPV